MSKLIKRITTLCFGFAMALGIIISSSVHQEASGVEAAKSDWQIVTERSQINATDSYILLTSDDGNYLNGSITSGSSKHFSTTAWADDKPSTTEEIGVVKFENVGENIWKIKLVSPTTPTSGNAKPYLTASKASSGSAQLSEADDKGWLLLEDSGKFNAFYNNNFNTATEPKYAALRSYIYNTTYQFRTYQTTSLSTYSGSTGNNSSFIIRKYNPGAAPATLTSIEVNTSPQTRYYVGDKFDPTNLSILRKYDDNTSNSLTYKGNESAFTFAPSLTTSLTSSDTFITITYDGKTTTLPITVKEGTGVIYDLSKNFATYTTKSGDSWGTTYAAHTITNTDIGASIGATLEFKFANKQTTGVGSTYPCIGDKTNSIREALSFKLTEAGKKIVSIEIVLVTRYTSTYPTLSLHKGSGVSSSALSTLTMSGTSETELSLSLDNLNDTMFSLGYNANQTGSNGAVGIKSIDITLTDAGTFGTLDHISIMSTPDNVIYHVGEAYSSTGLIVMAYDREDESGESKDVTSSISSSIANGYAFTLTDVPGRDVEISYTEGGITKTKSFHISVYATKQYELVTSSLSDWTGSYLIVDSDTSSSYAMNSALSTLDAENNYKTVTDSSGLITTGQELEWSIAKLGVNDNGETTYSIKSSITNKYIGSVTGSSNGLLVKDEPIVNTISFDNTDTENPNKVLIKGANGRHLNYSGSAYRFRYYNDATGVKLYKLVQSSYVEDYALKFLGAINCDASGINPPTFNIKEGSTYWSWALLASEYDLLSISDKEEFRLGVASSTGSDLQKALFTYDYIIIKYGEESYSNFMNRQLRTSPSNAIRLAGDSRDNAILVITIVSFISVTLIGGYIFSKRRRYN